jgi:hypothetical protein
MAPGDVPAYYWRRLHIEDHESWPQDLAGCVAVARRRLAQLELAAHLGWSLEDDGTAWFIEPEYDERINGAGRIES